MKTLGFLIASVLITLSASLPALASPAYPWQRYDGKCVSLTQNDGKQIGAVCPTYDNSAGTRIATVYYWGYLQNADSYGRPMANLSLAAFGNERYLRLGMAETTLGDGRNLPFLTVYKADFVLCGVFNCNSMAQDSDFSIYFQAEQKRPTHSPPFEYDNLFEQNYRGRVSLVPNS